MSEQNFERGGYAINDKVTWTSQAVGSQTTKTGVIVGIVPAKEYLSVYSLRDYIPGYQCGKYSIQFDKGKRMYESYLVEVNDSKTGKGKPKLYRPNVFNLRKVENLGLDK